MSGVSSLGFPFKSLEDSSRTRHAFDLCAVCPDTANRLLAFHIAFAQWYLVKFATDPLFPAKVLFSDEASFKMEGIFKTHNVHM